MASRGEGRSGIRVSAYGRSDRGVVRGNNQDRLLVVDLTDAPSPVEEDQDADSFTVGPVDFELGQAGAILMVADGMGGRAGGARASASAVALVSDAMYGPGSLEDDSAFVRRLETALTDASASIRAEGTRDRQLAGMGTTATLVGIRGDHVYVAQVGDSRAYLARNGTLARITRDQSLVQDLIDMGMLTEDDAHRAARNQILQALGASEAVTPALTHHELRKGDVLLLCSDGLSRVVTDPEVQTAIGGMRDCESLCEELVKLAIERGGPDNITVLAAVLDGEGLGAPASGDRVERRSYTPPAS